MKEAKKRGPKIPRVGQQREIALQCRPTIKRLIDKEARKAKLKPNDWLEYRICQIVGKKTPEQLVVCSLQVCLKELLAAQYPDEHGVQRDIPYEGFKVLLKLIRKGADAEEMRPALVKAGLRAKHIGLVLSVVHRLAIGVGRLVYIVE
jgi:hypothetical protein